MIYRFKKTLVLAQTALIITVSPIIAQAIDFRDKIRPFASPLIEDSIVVGMVIGIVKGNERQIIGYGIKSKKSNIPPDGKTLFEIGSTTKVFTGVVLADMVTRGEVRLETLVNDLLPAGVRLKDSAHPITLLHLTTHTSGLPRIMDLEPIDVKNPYAGLTMEMLNEYLNGLTLQQVPGSYAYSNLGAGLLGNVLALKAGTSYEELVLKIICQPLAMNDTRIVLNEEMESRLATPYNDSLVETSNWDILSLAGAGALRSTAEDLIKFARASMQYLKPPLGKAFKLSQMKQVDLGGGSAVGLGWHIYGDTLTHWHNGGTGGYASYLSVNPESSLAVVILTNTAAYNQVTQLGHELSQLLNGQDVNPPKRFLAVALDEETLKSYVGEYEFRPGIVLTVTLAGGQLLVQLTGQNSLPIFPFSETEFFCKVVDAQFTFVRNGEKKVTELILHQGGVDQKAVRK